MAWPRDPVGVLSGAMQPTLDAVSARDLFPITEHWIFMNHAGVSPMSQRARAATESLLDSLVNRPYLGMIAQERANAIREKLGALFNAPAGSFCLTRGTAHGISLLAGGLDWKRGDNVVGAEGEYPANVYPWMALRDRGVELRLASNRGGRVTPESVLEMVDDRTRVVALSHVEFWNGYRVDLETIGEECRRRGVILAVDAIQSAGALAVDLGSLPVDFAAAGAYKWLLGPHGIGFAYFSPQLLERVRPVLVGTGTVVKNSEYFDLDFTIEPSARRFEESSVADLTMAGFEAAIDVLLEVGMANVEERVLANALRLAEGLAAAGYELLEPWPRAGSEQSGVVSFRKPGAPAAEIVRDLNAAHIVGRQHADFVRLSPHFYNTFDEVDRVLEVLRPQA